MTLGERMLITYGDKLGDPRSPEREVSF
jgi:hypothetical protein